MDAPARAKQGLKTITLTGKTPFEVS